MKPIKEPAQVEHCGNLVGAMMRLEAGHEFEFNDDWVRDHSWRVVPVESAMRLPAEDIPRLVSVLSAAGYKSCIAVFNEAGYLPRLPVVVESDPPDDMATCYFVSISEAEFRELNRQLGPFRFVITVEERSWAVSCNESYNLFAGQPQFLESLLGKSLDEARQEFHEFASALSKGNPEEPLMRVSEHYAAL